MTPPATDHRRAIAERNIAAILDAAETLLARGAPTSVSAVAAEASVSRVTFYAHFATREDLLEALVARATASATDAFDAAEPDRGPAAEALERVLEVAWSELARYDTIAETAARELSPAALARAHEVGHRPILGLVERGRAEGAFRTDLPAAWLVNCWFALMHACAHDVRAGRFERDEALGVLRTTVRDLFAARP